MARLSNKNLIIIATVFLFLFFGGTAYLKVAYENANESSFLKQFSSNFSSDMGRFLLSDLTSFDWDEVCILFEVDSSYPVVSTHTFIKMKQFQPTHWSQWWPNFLPINWITQLIGVYVQDYETALIFVQENKVVNVFKTQREIFIPQFGDMSCQKNFYVEPVIEGSQKRFLLKLTEI